MASVMSAFLIDIPSFGFLRKRNDFESRLPDHHHHVVEAAVYFNPSPGVVFREHKRRLEWNVVDEDLSVYDDLFLELEAMAKVAARVSFVLLANPEEREVTCMFQALRSDWQKVRQALHEARKRLRSYPPHHHHHQQHSDFVAKGEAASVPQHLRSPAPSFDVLLHVAAQISRSLRNTALACAFLELADLLQLFLGLTALAHDFARPLLRQDPAFLDYLPDEWDVKIVLTQSVFNRFERARKHLEEIRFYASLRQPFENRFSSFVKRRGPCPSQVFATASGWLPVFTHEIPLVLVLPGPSRGLFAFQDLGFFSDSPDTSFLLLDYQARLAFFFKRASLPRLRHVLDALVQFASRFLEEKWDRRFVNSLRSWQDLVLLLRTEAPRFEIALDHSQRPFLNAQPDAFSSWASVADDFENAQFAWTRHAPFTPEAFEHVARFVNLWFHFASLLGFADGALARMTPETLRWPRGRASTTLFTQFETLSLDPVIDLPRTLSETVGQKDATLQGLHGGMRHLLTRRGSVPVLGLPPILKEAGHLLLDYLAAAATAHRPSVFRSASTRAAIEREIDQLFREHRDAGLDHAARAKAKEVLEQLFGLGFVEHANTLEIAVENRSRF